jgi:hypothetical protein
MLPGFNSEQGGAFRRGQIHTRVFSGQREGAL